jgi:8-oxo-dGTP diphosphatase
MIGAAVGIIVNDEKTLLCRRKRGSSYELKWEFPGGKIKNNETSEQCVNRELKEELSIVVESPILMDVVDTAYSDGKAYRMFYFYIKQYSGNIANNVFEEIDWVVFDRMLSMDILEGNREFIESYVQGKYHPLMKKA